MIWHVVLTVGIVGLCLPYMTLGLAALVGKIQRATDPGRSDHES